MVSLYLPSGSSSDERLQAKYRFMDYFLPHMAELQACGREVIVWRLEYRPPRDRPQELEIQPEELGLPARRARLAHGCSTSRAGWTYRRLHPEATEACYTWWSNRGQAWTKNVGWRLDYQIATAGIAAKATAASIYKEARFSDHAPLTIDYDFAP